MGKQREGNARRDLLNVMDIINISRATDVTKTVHNEPYDAISTTNHKLSQAGKTILITGGGTTIGNAIGCSFVRALAETVIILGRRLEVLQEGALRLEQEAKAAGAHTKIIHRQLDITDFSAVDAFWKQLASEGIAVDVFVSNAAAFPPLKPLLESGAKHMWSHLKTNFVVNVSSSITHNYIQAVTTKLAAYGFNKSCGTMLFQMVAKDTPVEEMQIISMHPGLIWSPEWVKMGFKDDVGFDNSQYAQGRFAWASWDINELSQGPIRERIEEDPYCLKMTIRGANP
ncbi:peroxisomal short-chain alcohol dehydrogenase [Fusarium subglutinans]|uniref:Peroxisomal short-chain alcohol dehydrogenase n=1 Tax=Gibberella subglutinans TaxID=42677 RepID=A0A8H5UPM5_GIBSU|nr:peroxisomal short-chain alcohol dehydrogenase [Fusarium subglutinans]KAF5594901.1 peroxisomal short-chain alcohol dehydrogenase [Fusarium subglutinans]